MTDISKNVQTLIKKAYHVPSTYHNTKWWNEKGGKYQTIIEGEDINVQTPPDTPIWVTDSSMTDSELSNLDMSMVTATSFSSQDCSFVETYVDSDYSMNFGMSPGAYLDSTGTVALFVRLKLDKMFDTDQHGYGVDPNAFAYVKYPTDSSLNSILSNAYQFNYNTQLDVSSTIDFFQPYRYRLEYSDNDTTFTQLTNEMGPWNFDFKSGIITFEDSPTEVDLTQNNAALYFTFVKYVGLRGVNNLDTINGDLSVGGGMRVGFSTKLLAGAGGLNGTGGSEGTATAESSYSDTQGATLAFDNDLTLEAGWHSTDASSSHWIAFEFPYDVVITSYQIWPRYTNGNANNIYNPKDWTLEGSTDSNPDTWYTIDEQENQTETDWPVAASEDDITNNVNYNEYYLKTTPSAYRNIRISTTAHRRGNATDTDYLVIGEIAYYGYIADGLDVSGTLTVGGSANISSDLTVEKGTITLGTGIYTLAGAGGLNGTGGDQGAATARSYYSQSSRPASEAFNNSTDNTDFYQAENRDEDNALEEWVAFEFPYDIYITHYNIWGINSGSNYEQYFTPPTDWIIQGSTKTTPDTDSTSSDWETIDTQSDQDTWSMTTVAIPDTAESKSYTIANGGGRGPYKHIRIVVSGITTTQTNGATYNGGYNVNIGEIGLYGYLSKVKVDCDAEITGNLTVGGDITAVDGTNLDLYTNTGSSDSVGWMEMRSDATRIGGNTIKFRPNSTSGTGGSDLITMSTGGYLGIGTDDPEYLLDVDGDANISSNLKVGGRIDTPGVNTTLGAVTNGTGQVLTVANVASDDYGYYSNFIVAGASAHVTNQTGEVVYFKAYNKNDTGDSTDFNYAGSCLFIGFHGDSLNPSSQTGFCLYYDGDGTSLSVDRDLFADKATMGNTNYTANRRFKGLTHFYTDNDSTTNEPIINISARSSHVGPYFSVGENTGTDNGNPLTNSIGSTFIINNDGYVGINNNSPSCELDVDGDVNINSELTVGDLTTVPTTGLIVNGRFRFSGTSSSSNFTNAYSQITYATGRLYISYASDLSDPSTVDTTTGYVEISHDLRATGDVYSNGTVLTSDNRIKHNESTLQNALEDIRQLTPLHYFKTNRQYEKDHDFSLNELGEPLDLSGIVLTKNKHYKLESGFIAQDVYEIPNLNFAVTFGDASFNDASMSINDVSDTLGLDYNSITVHAIAALQEVDREQQADKVRIAELETEVTTLKTQASTFETQMSELMARISSLENNNSTTTTDASDNTTTTDGS